MTLLTRRAFGKTIAATFGATLIAGNAFAASHAKKHTVTIKGFAFKSADLKIGVGDTVVFVNEDGAPHTATAGNGAFDTGRLNKGDSSSIKFDKAGVFEYVCNFHPMMKAKITVS